MRIFCSAAFPLPQEPQHDRRLSGASALLAQHRSSRPSFTSAQPARKRSNASVAPPGSCASSTPGTSDVMKFILPLPARRIRRADRIGRNFLDHCRRTRTPGRRHQLEMETLPPSNRSPRLSRPRRARPAVRPFFRAGSSNRGRPGRMPAPACRRILPSRISPKAAPPFPLRGNVFFPGVLVNGSATKHRLREKSLDPARRGATTTILSSADNSSIPRIAIMSCKSL